MIKLLAAGDKFFNFKTKYLVIAHSFAFGKLVSEFDVILCAYLAIVISALVNNDDIVLFFFLGTNESKTTTITNFSKVQMGILDNRKVQMRILTTSCKLVFSQVTQTF